MFWHLRGRRNLIRARVPYDTFSLTRVNEYGYGSSAFLFHLRCLVFGA
jgi:hypothetical protein